MSTRYIKYAVVGIIILVIISLLLSFWLPFKQSLRIVFGSVYLLFLPGFVWSWVFWEKGELDTIDRFILSLALSIAIVPMVMLLLNKIGTRINLINSTIIILIMIFVGILVLFLKRRNIRQIKNKI